ncbi:MAG: hypothetical protein M3Y24_00820 [Acidobacteriota bacterium]|nr:hypothetical protein [Acidobacteriota bacterium]
MRKHFPLLSRLALLFGAAVVLAAQTEHITPFTGTWKLNLAKSSFNPGLPFKSFTITFTPDGTRKLDLIGADAQSLKASLPWSDGKEVHVTGMENATATSKIHGKIFHDIWKQNGRIIEDVHGVVSSDGRTLTTTVDARYQQDRPIHNHLTFEMQ